MSKANFIETKQAIDAITASIDSQILSAKELNAKVISLNSSYSKIPSEYLKVSKDINETNRKLADTENNLIENKKRYAVLTAQEKVDNQILNVQKKREATLTSQVAGEYRKLSAQVAIASEKYQNIIARGRLATQTQNQFNKELRQAQNEFRTLQNRVLQADKAVDKWNRTGERSIGLGRDLLGAFGIVGGVTAFALITKDIFEEVKQIQSLDNALKLVTGTQENFYNQQAFLIRISEAYGVSINDLTQQFTQFYVSAKDKISGKEIQEIFESITKAGSAMGLTAENQKRAFLALNQMMSKGTIQAEELRGQLGEALPGAFGIMAKAVGVTEKELAKMMKAGDLLASEVLPKFAKQLEITYGVDNVTRIDNLVGAQNRLSNAWTDFIRTLSSNKGVINEVFSGFLDGLNFWLVKAKESIAILDYLRSKLGDGKDASKTDYQIKINKAQEEANRNIESLYKKEDKMNDVLKSKNSILESYERLYKTSSESQKKSIQDKIDKSKEEISILKTKIEQEQNISKIKKETIVQEAIENLKTLEAKQANISLSITETEIKRNELLNLKDQNGQYDSLTLKRIKDLNRERESLDAKRRINNVQITYNNALIETAKNTDSVTDKTKKGNTATKEQLENAKKIREQLEKDNYDLQISNLKRDKLILEQKLKNEGLYGQEKIDLQNKIAGYEIAILTKKFEYELKLAKNSLDKQKQLANEYITDLEKIGDFKSIFKRPDVATDAENPETPSIDTPPDNDLTDIIKDVDDTAEALKRAKDASDAFIMSFQTSFMDDAGLGSVFDLLNGKLDEFGDNWQAKALLISEAMQEMFNFIWEMSQENFDHERELNKQQTADALAFAGESQTAQDEIKKQSEEKERQIKIREFKAKKDQAKFNIGVDLAQAILATFARVGFPAGIPLAAIMTAVGLAQLAKVNAQEIPAYKDGTLNHKGGAMLINDGNGSNFKEIVETPDGKRYAPQKRNMIVNAPKGTKVFNYDQQQKELDRILMSNNIDYAPTTVSEQIDIRQDLHQLGRDVVSAINNKTEYHQTFDGNGIKNYIGNGHSLKEIKNNHVTFKQQSV